MNQDKLKEHLERRLQFERIIFTITSELARVGDDNQVGVVESSLGEIGTVVQSRRVFLLLFNKDPRFMEQVYEWTGKDVAPVKEILRKIAVVDPSWMESRLKEAEIINLSDNTKDLKEKGKDSLNRLSIDTLHVFPIFVNLSIEGFLCFDEPAAIRNWEEEDIAVLRTISQIIGNSIDRILTEEKLKKSEKKYRNVLESIMEAYFEVDLKGNFTFFNYALCNLTGISKQDLLGSNYALITTGESAREIFKQFNEIFQKRRNRSRIEFQIKNIDGRMLQVEASVYLRRDADENIVGFRGFIQDITERKRSEELKEKFAQYLRREVKARTKELEEAMSQQKKYLDQIIKASQFKSEFMATMSHELRTPLNAIIGFSELLLEGCYGKLNEDQMSFLHDVHSSAEHLLEMINRILDISKIEAGRISLNVEPVIVNDLVKSVQATLKPLYKKKDLEFNIIGLDEEKVIYADPIRLKEIMINLIGNAIKYTVKGSVNILYTDKGEYSEISVIDTGVGIDEKDHDRVFKEFERIESNLSENTQGTGLGLPLAKRLVNLHGGEITFKSTPGEGSTFSFTLPKRLGSQARTQKPYSSMGSRKTRSIKLLLIEDTRKDALIIKKLLSGIQDMTITVDWRERLSEGISYLQRNSVDLILLDLSLPDSNGLDTVRKVLDQETSAPIIVLTVKDDDNFASRVVMSGAQDYLVKSEVNSHSISRAIRYAISRYQHLTSSN